MNDDKENKIIITDTAKLYFTKNETTGTVSCKANFSKDISAELYKHYNNAEKVSVSLYKENDVTCIRKL